MDYKCKDFLILYIFIWNDLDGGSLYFEFVPKCWQAPWEEGCAQEHPGGLNQLVAEVLEAGHHLGEGGNHEKVATLPSTTSTVCPDISAGSGGNVQETSCSKLKTLRRWRLIITFVNVINRGGNSVIKRQNLWWVCCGPSSNNQSHAALAITFIEE